MDQTTARVSLATSPAESEAYQMLLARAHRKTGAIPHELVVRHVLAVTAGADWPVRREALEALLRRFAFGQADRLRIVTRPGGVEPLGLYATRRQDSPARPYRTLLRSVEPIQGSCSCPDFLRSSLGLCKHLLAVLEDIASKPRAVERARRATAPDAAPLRWDPSAPSQAGATGWRGSAGWTGPPRPVSVDGSARPQGAALQPRFPRRRRGGSSSSTTSSPCSGTIRASPRSTPCSWRIDGAPCAPSRAAETCTASRRQSALSSSDSTPTSARP